MIDVTEQLLIALFLPQVRWAEDAAKVTSCTDKKKRVVFC